MDPTQSAGKIKSILKGVAGAGDGVTYRGVSTDLNEGRSRGRGQRGIVVEAQARKRLVIQVLVELKRIPQIRKARDADYRWRKDVRLLRDKILGAVILAHRKARNIGAHRRKRIGGWTGAEHVAKIESVGTGKIVIEAQSELIVVLAESLRGDVSVFADVGQREKRQD